MAQYLVAIHLPDNFDPSQSDPAMMEDIHALNRDMIADGVRLFAGGLSPASKAKSLRAERRWQVADDRRAVPGG